MDTRKIIQIVCSSSSHAFHPDSNTEYIGNRCNMLYALCDDGTVWERNSYSNSWKKVDSIPQD